MKNVFFIECSEPFWVDVAKQMHDNHQYQAVYWSGLPRQKEYVLSNFSEIMYHESFNTVRGIVPEGFDEKDLHPLDSQVLQEMAPFESIIIGMMDRMDPDNSFYYHERLRLYHHLLRFWYTFLDRLDPQLIVFSSIPHLVYDYILYSICKLKGIKTVVFQTSSVNGIILPQVNFEEMSTVAYEYNKMLENGVSEFCLEDASIEHIKMIKGEYNDYLNSMAEDTRDMILIGKNFIKNTISSPIQLCKRFLLNLRALFIPAPLNYLKQRNVKIAEMTWNDFNFRSYKRKSKLKKRRLKKIYNSLTVKPNFSHKYIYIPLHYQPECSTSPMAGIFSNQFLMIQLLSGLLPDDWHIYVKENFWQNSDDSYGERSERKYFYEDVATLKNVSFVSIEVPQWDLIDNAKIVATLTGTSGWETILRGVPTMIFGHAWYKGCEGVFSVASSASVLDVINKVIQGYVVDMDKVKLYIHSLEKNGFRAYVSSHYARVVGINVKQNVSTLVEAILSIAKNKTMERN